MHRLCFFVWASVTALYTVLSVAPIRLHYLNATLFGGLPLDKTLHFLFFAALAASAFLLFESRAKTVLALIALLATGIFAEYLQQFSPTRSTSELDGIANVLGCIAGSLIGLFLRYPLRHRLFPSARITVPPKDHE